MSTSPEVREAPGGDGAGPAAWLREARRRMDRELEVAEATREEQMDRRRQLEGLRRAEGVLEACLRRRTREGRGPRPCGVLAHRNDWMRRRWADTLEELGLTVVCEGRDGAAALGMTLAEQPDVLLMEAHLPWLAPREVLLDVREYAPATCVLVQLGANDDPVEMLEAGVHALVGRLARPWEVAECAMRLLADQSTAGGG